MTFTVLFCSVFSLSFSPSHFFQSVPVAASTISLLMLSLDRYATVKHPRLAQLRQRRFLPTFLAFASWITAICISVPILLDSGINSTLSINTTGLNHTIPMPSKLTSACHFFSSFFFIGENDMWEIENVIYAHTHIINPFLFDSSFPRSSNLQ